jgi:uncharacterized protein (TIGR00159 family)
MPLLFFIGFLEISLADIIDILLVSYLMYQLYKLLKGSVAVKILLGILSIYLVYVIVNAFGLRLLSNILGQFLGVGVIAALILFQQEIRKFLLLIGRKSVFGDEGVFSAFSWRKNPKMQIDLNAVIEAARTMGATNTGALIVFGKSSELKFYADSGDELDAVLSKRILLSIFNKYSPLHDGAVIIGRNGRIKAARCILPVSENDEIPASMGLRHRAAIGLTELTDAVVLVVSEETGEISLIRNAQIYKNLPIQELRNKLNRFITEKEVKKEEENPAEESKLAGA